jgi:tetratricopeptide (TPR) repeat protein
VLEAAQKYVEKKKYDKAIVEFQKVIQEDPNDARILLKIGDLQSKALQYGEAIETYERVGSFYAQQGFALKAIAVFKQIKEIIAKHVPNLEERFGHITPKLAELYQQLGLTSDALAALDEVATRLQRQQRDQEAIDVFRKIVELDPTNPLPHLRLAEALSRVKDAESAVMEFGIAASLLVKLGRRDDAIKVFERLLHHKPDPSNARICAELYLERAQPTDGMQALAKLQMCFQANPKDLDTLALLARAFQAIGQAGKGIEVQKEMARLAKEQGKVELFGQLIERLQRLAPNDEQVQALLATTGQSQIPPSVPPPSSTEASQPDGYGASAVEELSYIEAEDSAVAAPEPPPASAPRYERVAADAYAAELSPREEQPAEQPAQESYDAADAGPDLVVDGTEDGVEFVDDAPDALALAESIKQALIDAATFRRVRLFDKAIDTIREVLEVAPTSIELRQVLRDVLLETREYEQASRQMLALASLHIDVGDVEEAARALYDVLSIEPTNRRAEDMLRGLGYDVASATDVSPALAPAVASRLTERAREDATYGGEQGSGGGSDAPLASYELDDTGNRHAVQPEAPAQTDENEGTSEGFESPLPSFPLEAPESEAQFDLVQQRASSPEESGGFAARGEQSEQTNKPPPHTELEDALEEVDFYASRGLYEDARAILVEQLGLHPNHILLTERMTELEAQEQSARGGSGTREVPRGNVDRSFDIAASLDAIENLDTASELPASFQDAGKQIDVEEVFAKFKEGVAKQVSADDAQSHYDLGLAYKEMGLIEDAIRELDVAARDPKRECVCRSMIGNIQVERGKWNEAIEAYLQGLHAKTTPDQETVLCYEVGVAYEATKRAKEALMYYNRVMRREPNHRDVQERVRRLSAPLTKIAPRAAAVGADDEFERAFDEIIGEGKLP